MEFKLNKIDTDIRRKMQEKTRDGKVHGNNAITIKKDLKEDKKDRINDKRDKDSKSNKSFFSVDGIRYEEKTLNIEAEKVEFLDEEKLKGHRLDVKK